MQDDLVRLHVGIVGTGSVGAMVAKALARTGFEHITLIDFDSVETVNLDRLLHALPRDIKLARSKVDVLRRGLLKTATAARPQVTALDHSVVEDTGFRAALDCDVLFSCVDRPWPRSQVQADSQRPGGPSGRENAVRRLKLDRPREGQPQA